MKVRLYIKYILIVLFLAISFVSCQKQDYNSGFVAFANVYFQNNSVLNSDLGVKVKGTPISWNPDGSIKVPEGETNFEFYNKNSGVILGEKTVLVSAKTPETWMVFHPSADAPVAFLNPNGQADEEAAPEGFMKIKIANYAGDLVPYNDLDIIVVGLNMNLEPIDLETLEDVGENLGEEAYRLVPTGGSDILAYTFKFKDRNSQEILKNYGEDDYWNQNDFLYPESMNPIPEKRIYTIYLTSFERSSEYTGYLKSGNGFYDITPNILYAN